MEALMSDLMTRMWWLLLLRGLLAIAFGVFCFAMPGMALTTLVLLFGAYALADGIVMISAAIRNWSSREDRWVVLLIGLLGIGIGAVTLLAPGLTAIGLIAYIAAWSLATGVLHVVAAIRLRQEIRGEMWLVLSGVASIVFAVLVFLQPLAGALAVLWLVGAYALVAGVLMIALGLEVHSAAIQRRSKPATTAAA
jgi:uncharacterized membrane protein HdeD (DUF308 family)